MGQAEWGLGELKAWPLGTLGHLLVDWSREQR